MYIVRDKITREIIHINPTPLSQQLKNKDVYYNFDPKRMEIGKTDSAGIPKHFNINAAGQIVALTPQELIEAGILALKPDEKIAGEKIVKKTLSEQLAQGLFSLAPTQKIAIVGADEQIVSKTLLEQVSEGLLVIPPTQKIVSEGEYQRIVDKTLSEQATDGLINLLPTQKIVAEGSSERIVEKTITEQVTEGLIKLLPNQKLDADQIIEKTLDEMLNEGLITLDDAKKRKTQYFSDLAFEKRVSILPDFKLQNAALGIYDAQTVANYRAIVQAFRDEFHRIQVLIEAAKTIKKIESITENFPKEIVTAASD